jgi:hypothetical protein
MAVAPVTTTALGCSGCVTEPGALPLAARVSTLFVAVIFFAGCFVAASVVLERFPFYHKKTPVIRADLCSRINSSVHSFIIVPGLIYGLLATTWDSNYYPLTSVATMQLFLIVSVAYFTCDFVTTVWYRLPRWEVFAVHHVAAVTPYVIYLFVPACPVGVFVLSAFLLVETTNVPLNIQTFLEQSGHGNSRWYAATIYTTIGGWVIFRIANPLYLLYVIHAHVWPAAPLKWCLAFSLVCAYVIAAFCILVFVHVLLPEVRNRWKAYPNAVEVAGEPNASKALRINVDLPLTPEEYELTAQSPTRIVLYEAREKAFELETVVHNHASFAFDTPAQNETRQLVRRNPSQQDRDDAAGRCTTV